jgi:hypothetical protein
MRVLRVHLRTGMAREFLPDFHGHTCIGQSCVGVMVGLAANAGVGLKGGCSCRFGFERHSTLDCKP